MTDLNTLPDDIKQAFNYFIKRVGELELSSFLVQTEMLKVIQSFEQLKKSYEDERKNWQSVENKYKSDIDQYLFDISQLRVQIEKYLQTIKTLETENEKLVQKEQKTKKNKTKR